MSIFGPRSLEHHVDVLNLEGYTPVNSLTKSLAGNYPMIFVGTTSSFLVHFLASYVGLPECSWRSLP